MFRQEDRSFIHVTQRRPIAPIHSRARLGLWGAEWPALWHTPSKRIVLVELITPPVLHFHPRPSDMGTGDTHPPKAYLSRSDAAKYAAPLVPFQPPELSLRQLRPTLDFSRNRMCSGGVSVAAEHTPSLTKIRLYGPSQPSLSSLKHCFD